MTAWTCSRFVTSSANGRTASPYFFAKPERESTERAVATTLSPRASAPSAQMRPNPRDAPVMNHTFSDIEISFQMPHTSAAISLVKM
jgi:hypothetical protein